MSTKEYGTDLNPEVEAEILRTAYEYGMDGFKEFDGSVDWDELVSALETEERPLPSDWDHPFLKAIKGQYRRGKKEARG